jgi:hypothetical protein
MKTKIFYTLLPPVTITILLICSYPYIMMYKEGVNPFVTEKWEYLPKLAKLTTVPTDESPKIKILSDIETLKSQQEFFKDAQDGDILFTYASASKAYIYSPANDLIVNEGPADTESDNEKYSRLVRERRSDSDKIPNAPFRFEGFPAPFVEYTPVPADLSDFTIEENPSYWNDWKSIYNISDLSREEGISGHSTRHFAGHYIFVTHGNGTMLLTSIVDGKTGTISGALPSVPGGSQFYLRPDSRLVVLEHDRSFWDDTMPRLLSYYFMNENLEFILLGSYELQNREFKPVEVPYVEPLEI